MNEEVKTINKTKYYLIQVFLNNNEPKINKINYICTYLETKNHYFAVDYIINNGNESEYFIEVDKQTFYEKNKLR